MTYSIALPQHHLSIGFEIGRIEGEMRGLVEGNANDISLVQRVDDVYQKWETFKGLYFRQGQCIPNRMSQEEMTPPMRLSIGEWLRQRCVLTEAELDKLCSQVINQRLEKIARLFSVMFSDFTQYRETRESDLLNRLLPFFRMANEELVSIKQLIVQRNPTFPEKQELYNMQGRLRNWCYQIDPNSSSLTRTMHLIQAFKTNREVSRREKIELKSSFDDIPCLRGGHLEEARQEVLEWIERSSESADFARIEERVCQLVQQEVERVAARRLDDMRIFYERLFEIAEGPEEMLERVEWVKHQLPYLHHLVLQTLQSLYQTEEALSASSGEETESVSSCEEQEPADEFALLEAAFPSDFVPTESTG